MFLLDTDVLSTLRRGNRNHETVRWVEAQRTADMYLSVVTVRESGDLRGLERYVAGRGSQAHSRGRLSDVCISQGMG